MELEVESEIVNLETGTTILKTEGKDLTKGTVLHLHGLPGGKVGDYKDLHRLLAPRGYRVISYNYPGLWGTGGTFSPKSAVDGTRRLLEHINDSYDGKITIFAESFGGYVAVRSLELDTEVSHIYHRAPLPGLEFIANDQTFQQQLAQSMALLIQAGIMKVEEKDITNVLQETSSSSFSNKLEQLHSSGMKQEVIVGQDDEILPVEVIDRIYSPYAEVNIKDQLSHNNINRSEWIDIITRADIFFQS